MSRNSSSSVDIFQLLAETEEKEKRKRREELLAPLKIEEFFVEGNITIDKKTCRGVECKLCIKACPTNALYWKIGEVGVTEELCIYCGACVLSCIVDDCIKVVRKRPDGEVERYSKPRDFSVLQSSINSRKRFERVKDVFPTPEDYIERYWRKP
ncbi:MAG: 4Fe-4S dicluster domain-containing protein [Candidatus Bathycorpusculaceae bacterium]